MFLMDPSFCQLYTSISVLVDGLITFETIVFLKSLTPNLNYFRFGDVG